MQPLDDDQLSLGFDTPTPAVVDPDRDYVSGTREQAVARRSDPGTSHAAARSVERLRDRQQAVLDLLRRLGPMTDEEIAQAYAQFDLPKQSPSGLRTRRSELQHAGFVEDSGERRTTESGRSSIVWREA